jgi:hypothetical protein
MNISPKIYFVILTLLLGATEGFRHWWFSRVQNKEDVTNMLAWTPPENAVNQNFSQTSGGKILNHDEGLQFLIKGAANDPTVDVIYLDYEKGNKKVLGDLVSHTPEVCFAHSGARQIEEFAFQTLNVAGEEIYVRQWLFENRPSEVKFFVFKIVWSPGETPFKEVFRQGLSSTLSMNDNHRRARLRAAWQGLGSPATRMILALVKGTEDRPKAWKAFKEATIDRLTKPQ